MLRSVALMTLIRSPKTNESETRSSSDKAFVPELANCIASPERQKFFVAMSRWNPSALVTSPSRMRSLLGSSSVRRIVVKHRRHTLSALMVFMFWIAIIMVSGLWRSTNGDRADARCFQGQHHCQHRHRELRDICNLWPTTDYRAGYCQHHRSHSLRSYVKYSDYMSDVVCSDVVRYSDL